MSQRVVKLASDPQALLGRAPPGLSSRSRASRDPGRLAELGEFARSLGFVGKFAIHPRQLAVLHDVFTPSAEALDSAQTLLDAFHAPGGEPVKLPDGEFVGLPVADRAHRFLQLAARLPITAAT